MKNSNLTTCPNGCNVSFSCEDQDWNEESGEDVYIVVMQCDGCEYKYDEVYSCREVQEHQDV